LVERRVRDRRNPSRFHDGTAVTFFLFILFTEWIECFQSTRLSPVIT
jgi:hypothetical protein